MQPLVPELHGALQVPRFERPPLAAANTPSILQSSCAALTEPGQPIVGAVEADPCFCRQFRQGAVLEKVLIDEPEPALVR